MKKKYLGKTYNGTFFIGLDIKNETENNDTDDDL